MTVYYIDVVYLFFIEKNMWWSSFLDVIKTFSNQTELTQMSVVLTIVIIITGILKVLKQPIVIGYLLAGVLVGPFALGLVATNDHSFIELFSHLGIALLLFMV